MPSSPWKAMKVGSNLIKASEDHCYRQLMRWMGSFAFALGLVGGAQRQHSWHLMAVLLSLTQASFICIPSKQ